MKWINKHRSLLLPAGLLIVTVTAAYIHLNTRTQVPEGNLLLTAGENSREIRYDELKFGRVTGIRVNGRGEELAVEAPGIRLEEVLAYAWAGDGAYDIEASDIITVVSDDSYQAELSGEEVLDEDRAYLILEEEGLRLVVFGDTDSKRSVSDVKQIVLE